MTIGIINYGLGNLGSVTRALNHIGEQSQIITSIDEADICSHIILPGVGGFSEAMNLIKQKNVDQMLVKIQQENKPLLGICLGMQLLADHGFEGKETAGLGFIGGNVKKLYADNKVHKVPHIGWSEITITNPSPLFKGIADQTDFYFVHSFVFDAKNDDHVISTTSHSTPFVSAVQKGNCFGVQFHPEKSSKGGLKLLQNFCELRSC